MKPTPPPFVHLQSELQGSPAKKDKWAKPAMAAAVFGVLFVVGVIFFMPVPDTSRDFSQEGNASNPTASAERAGFEPVRWAQLIPAGWDASDQLRSLQARQAGVSDDDPRARSALVSLREVLDAAPSDPTLNGRRVAIPGYVVPLDRGPEGMTEFLLVPYFGACIHTPPPPANQVIHVTTAQPMKDLRSMDPVWVQGTLSAGRSDTDMAVSGYRMLAVSAAPYDPAQTPSAR